MKNTLIAVDLAKSVFEVAVSDRPGRVKERKRLSRAGLLKFFVNRQPALVLLESCGSAHFWGRQIRDLGHEVLLLPPHAVRPYVPRNKTDRTDAKGMLEAHRNEQIHPVPLKTIEQQALCALHRLRSGWLDTRTARINSVRGLLREFGITIPVGAKKVVPQLEMLLADADSALPDSIRPALHEARLEIRQIEQRMQLVENQLEALARQIPTVHKLLTIPGIGVLTATALVAFVGDVRRFPSGRHFASYLGLTPRENSSALKRRLGSISKRGDVYLRWLLIHGGRSILANAPRRQEPSRLRTWALNIQQKRGHNKAVVAMANKLARFVWAVWRKDVEYAEPQDMQAA